MNETIMKWLGLVLKLTPYVVAGIEKIHGDTVAGDSKKKMAQDALGIATAGALSADPNDNELIQASSTITGLVIDKTVSDFNSNGTFWHKGAAGPQPIGVPARPGETPAPNPLIIPGASQAGAPQEVIEGPGLHTVVPA